MDSMTDAKGASRDARYPGGMAPGGIGPKGGRLGGAEGKGGA